MHPDGKGDASPIRREIATLFAESMGLEQTAVMNGIDVLVREEFARLRGLRIGLITNQTGRDREGRATIDLLHTAKDVKLVALFSPEHGIRGVADVNALGGLVKSFEVTPDPAALAARQLSLADVQAVPPGAMALVQACELTQLPAWGQVSAAAGRAAAQCIEAAARAVKGKDLVRRRALGDGRAGVGEVEFDGVAVVPAPDWLLELLAAEVGNMEPRRPKHVRLVNDPLPGDWWAATVSARTISSLAARPLPSSTSLALTALSFARSGTCRTCRVTPSWTSASSPWPCTSS